MEHGRGDNPGPDAVPQELLDEMLWVFRVEDASPWNYAMLVLVAVVLALSGFLLRRSVLANRKQKAKPPEKPARVELAVVEAGAGGGKGNSLNALTETLLTEKPPETLLTEKPPETLLTEKPPETLLTEKPPETLLTEKPPETLLTEKPPETLLTEKPPETLLTEKPPETTLLEKLPPEPEDSGLKEKEGSSVFLPEPQESES